MTDDFAAAINAEEVDTPTPEPIEEAPVVEAEPEPEAAPEPSWWEKAGFDSEDDAMKKVSNLRKWEKDVQLESTRRGAERKAPEPAPVVDDDGDPFAALDPESAKLLSRAIDKKVAEKLADVAPQAALAEHLFREQQRTAFEKFAEAEGIDTADLADIMDTYNLQPTDASSEAFQRVYEAGAAIYRRQNPTDIESEVERRLAEKLAELKKDGASVKAVEPHKAKVEDESKDDTSDPGFFARMLRN